ncbi:DUF1010 domain-containing protein [Alicycliphilus denitrificans]|uniref:DUF1010 domain-containing protein n=1 Tax=Alicycliphilus denitrificans TaxID=179636 RepID=UPI00384F37FE
MSISIKGSLVPKPNKWFNRTSTSLTGNRPLAFGSNCAVKPTRLRRAAYFRR